MSGLAGASWSAVALWLALLLTALLTGTLLAAWNARDERLPERVERLLLAAAAAGVVAWFANAGSLIGTASGIPLLDARVPVAVGPGYRLAVLWATLPGAGLTFAAALLVVATLSSGGQRDRRSRRAALTSAFGLSGLAIAVWFAPSPDELANAIPPFVQHPSAALAPLFALVGLVGLAFVAASFGAGRTPSQQSILVSWVATTLAVASEQLARTRLGVGPGDAITLGSASSGLVLWLVTSALVHRRIQGALRHGGTTTAPASSPAYAALAAHLGAGLVVISFAMHAFAARSNISLGPGAPIELTDSFRQSWTLANQGVSRFDAEGVDVLSLVVEARDPRGNSRLLMPAIHEHHGRDGRHLYSPVTLRASADGILQGLRIILLQADSLDVASVRVTFLPVPFLWPAGIVLLLLSAALAIAAEGRVTRFDE